MLCTLEFALDVGFRPKTVLPAQQPVRCAGYRVSNASEADFCFAAAFGIDYQGSSNAGKSVVRRL
jgi:hypothetical protein